MLYQVADVEPYKSYIIIDSSMSIFMYTILLRKVNQSIQTKTIRNSSK